MSYPQFDLEKAFQGEPIAFPLNKTIVVKGYLRQSSLDEEMCILEFEHPKSPNVRHRTYTCDLWSKSSIARFALGMWAEPVKFEHWDLLSNDVVKIVQYAEDCWTLIDVCDCYLATTHAKTWIQGFFPDCPVGTVIERP